jgi:capsular exopolysaccharide synthesis family protein
MPVLRIRTRQFPAALVQDVHLGADVDMDSLQLRFGGQKVTVHRQTEQREAAYGDRIVVRGIQFTVAGPARHESGTLYIISRDDAIDNLTGRLLVKPRENTDVIDIAFTASDPERAQAVANRVAQVFQAGNSQAAQREAQRRREFIETQLRFNDSLFGEAREALNAFRTREPRALAERSAEAGSFGGLAERRAELEMERRQYASVLGRLKDTSSAVRRAALINGIAESPGIATNPVVARLYDQLVQYENVRDSLTTGDWARAAANPDVQRLQPLIAATEARLAGAVQSVVASIDARIRVLSDLQVRGVATARHLSSVQAIEDALGEQVQNARRIADQLRLEYQKARIAEAVEGGKVEIVDLAPLPERPLGVGWARTLVFGILLGVLLGGGSAFLADHLNTSVHRREHVTQLGLPVLGVVPHAGGNSTDETAPIIEAMRGIRFNVLNAYGAAGPVMFTITSPGAREGKSFVSSNLAVAFADAGHRTLLVDADLRRGSLYRILNTKRKPGLTDVLHGEVSPEDAIQTTPFPPLCFIACGTRTPDAPELLSSEAMAKFVAGVRLSFSVVIVDSPPLGAGVDAYALGSVTGNVLMVLRLGTTDREVAEAKLDLLDRLPVRLLGTVLNDVPEHSAYSTYSYYMDGYAYEAEQGREPRTLAGRQPATRDRDRARR